MHNAISSFGHRFFILTALGLHISSYAQMAQVPLLTRSSAVEPNLVFIYDDSGSMDDDYMYQYGGTPGIHGMDGPGGSYGDKSPDVNLIYYDPRKRYLPRVDAAGADNTYTTVSSSTTFNVYFYKNTSGVNATWNNTGNNATLSGSFFNPYTPPTTALAAGATTGLSYPRAASSSQSTYPKWANRTDCSSASCTWAEERKNYSIWSTFHSTRDKLAKTGIGLAFKGIGNTIRLGWGKISQLKSSSTLNQGVSLFDTTTKSEFHTWLYGINNSGSTPNVAALNNVGRYYSRDDSDGPWGSTPKKTSTGVVTPGTVTSTEAKSAHLSCRRSFSMLMTDGYYNDTAPPTGVGNFDGTNGSVISDSSAKTYQYKPVGTFNAADTSSNSMADFAMKYWATDLRPSIDNNVPADATTNESFWQNMSFYGITLGVTGSLAQTQATKDALVAGTINWPTPVQNTATAIDDMWHATLNGRGSMLVATDAGSLTDSITKMMASIGKVTSSQSGVAVSTASLRSGTRKYIPKYTTVSWIGNVVARDLDPDTGNETGTAWQVDGTDSTGTVWAGIPAHGSRSIYIGTTNLTGTKAVPFKFADMTTATIINDLASTYRTTAMVDYLRGDATNEGTGTTNYRVRESRLGDIVNSSPVFIKGFPGRELVDPSNFSGIAVMEYAATTDPVSGTGAAYAAYKASLSGRGEGVLMVGANDGMVHAFRDGTSAPPANKGVENFAYVPRTILSNMYLLSEKTYAHRYFVDGPNIEADLYTSGSNWKQVVVGTTGAGGMGVYAFDVSSPISMDASSVLWEVNPTVSGYTNLGSVLFDVQTGVMKIGTTDTWVAIFGNGYESASGRASLFIVNLETGALIRELQTPLSTGGGWSATVLAVTTPYKNGLGGVKIVRDSNEQRIQGAYAGDLRGNMWRFDLSNINSSNWTTGILYSTPAVTASTSAPTGYPQPITATPETIPHPNGGRIVVFGTGKFYQDTDATTPYSTQAIYGVWDKVSFGSTFPTTDYPVSSTSLVTNYLGYITGTTFLQVTSTYGGSTPPGYIDWTTKMGWQIDLPSTGQRLVYPVEKVDNRNSRVVGFGTISPYAATTNACVAAASGSGWDFFLDGLYGGDPGRAPDVPTANWTNAYSGYTGAGYSVGGQTTADGRNTTVRVDSKSDDTQRTFVTLGGSSSSATQSKFLCKLLGTCVTPPPVTPPAGTKKILTRDWRQLFLR